MKVYTGKINHINKEKRYGLLTSGEIINPKTEEPDFIYFDEKAAEAGKLNFDTLKPGQKISFTLSKIEQIRIANKIEKEMDQEEFSL